MFLGVKRSALLCRAACHALFPGDCRQLAAFGMCMCMCHVADMEQQHCCTTCLFHRTKQGNLKKVRLFLCNIHLFLLTKQGLKQWRCALQRTGCGRS